MKYKGNHSWQFESDRKFVKTQYFGNIWLDIFTQSYNTKGEKICPMKEHHLPEKMLCIIYPLVGKEEE